MKRIVLAGAGHAHIAVLRRFAKAKPDAEIILINDGPYAWYTGALPALIRGDIAESAARLDVRALAQNCGAKFIDARYAGFENGLVVLENHQPIAFDLLSLSIGGEKTQGGVKPIPEFLARLKLWGGMATPKLGIIGAGVAGVELALALRVRLGVKAQITLCGAAILSSAPPAAQRIAVKALQAANIIHTETLPEGLDATIRAYTSAPSLFIRPTLQLAGYDNVFATGDCARFSKPLPRSGAIAVRQGHVLAYNLLFWRAAAPSRGLALPSATVPTRPPRAIPHTALKIFKPPQETLAIMSVNAERALAWYGPFSFYGTLPMRLKSWIDRQWIS